MKKLSMLTLFLAMIILVSCGAKTEKQNKQNLKITFRPDTTTKKIDVMAGEKFFTSLIWPDNITKPVLYPVCTSVGTEITRGFPLKPKVGERVDHPHQIGMWFTYGNVNGLDFWGNGSQGLGTRNENGGLIKHLKVDKILEGTREGMFGIRVARHLELPSQEEITLYSADGQPEKVKAMSSEGITGNYRSSEGITGKEVWGTRAKWMYLYGSIGNEKISVAICDHPKNPNYPTYWHAREYGLFAANPLGVKDFTHGNEELNFSIPAGKSAIFRYRVIIGSGAHLTDAEINAYSDDFSEKYE